MHIQGINATCIGIGSLLFASFYVICFFLYILKLKISIPVLYKRKGNILQHPVPVASPGLGARGGGHESQSQTGAYLGGLVPAPHF